MKPTKRDIRIVEHFVKKTTKSMMNEENLSDGEKKVLTFVKSYAKFIDVPEMNAAMSIIRIIDKKYK
jgi:hypothetical protein